MDRPCHSRKINKASDFEDRIHQLIACDNTDSDTNSISSVNDLDADPDFILYEEEQMGKQQTGKEVKASILLTLMIFCLKVKMLIKNLEKIYWQIMLKFSFFSYLFLFFLLISKCKVPSVKEALVTGTKQSNYQDTNIEEINALIGLVLLSSILKSNDEKSLLCSRGMCSVPLYFEQTMSVKRYEILVPCLRFDDV